MTELRQQRIVLETERHRITGDITLPAEGIRGRLTDLLNREGVIFIPVDNATITDLDGEGAEERPFVAVARDHIQLAFED